MLVDTNGLLLKVQVHPAHVSDSQGGQQLLMGLDAVFPRLRHLWADGGYFQVFVEWVRAQLGWTVSVVKPARRHTGVMDELARLLMTPAEYARVYGPGFRVLPRRWVVERTFAWLGKQRRLSKDYELLPSTGETWIYLTMVRLMTRRLADARD